LGLGFVLIYARKSPWRGCTRRICICGGVIHRHPIIIRELVNLAKDNPYPIIIGGDFNLLRYPQEKSRGRFDTHWSFLFNVVIDSWIGER
jgi:hypothetical protein